MTKESSLANEGNTFVLDCATEVLCAFLSKNPMSASELPTVIKSVHAATKGLYDNHGVGPTALNKLPVPIKKSIGQDYLICFEDGQKFKSLKRHLKARYGMTPEEYRTKWGLPTDYPMVAPGYAKQRSLLAKKMGLGRREKNGTSNSSGVPDGKA